MGLVVGVNSWVSVADANDYFENRYGIGTTWSALSDSDKEVALITAYKQINNSGKFAFPDEYTDQNKAASSHLA